MNNSTYYLVLAYPEISKEDFDFIQEYRSRNDHKYFKVVDLHFTIFFACDKFAEQEFIEEVKKQTTNIKSFEFELNLATINFDDSKKYYHEFLVPEKGYKDIVLLHDKIYSDKFLPFLKYEIDYIPHVGIGNSENVNDCKKRIDDLNFKGLSVKGIINTLDIVEYKDGVIKTIEKIILKKS
jgi:hypothetical protein